MHKLAILIAICFSVFIGWILYLANSGGNSIFFDLVRATPYGDKVGHLCLFGTLTAIVILASKFRTFSLGRLHIYYGAAVVALFVFGEEISQTFIATRTFDLIDLLLNFVGIALFSYLVYVAKSRGADFGQRG